MQIALLINQKQHTLEVSPAETLLSALRRLGYFGAKFGCDTGECGVCAVLVDGKPLNSCRLLAAQAEGHVIETIESLGLSKAGSKPKACILSNKPSSKAARSNVDIAPQPKFWLHSICWSITPIPPKPKCGMPFPACCVGVPAT